LAIFSISERCISIPFSMAGCRSESSILSKAGTPEYGPVHSANNSFSITISLVFCSLSTSIFAQLYNPAKKIRVKLFNRFFMICVLKIQLKYTKEFHDHSWGFFNFKKWKNEVFMMEIINLL